MPLGQRVVLIGGGHNALIAAFYLAKGGFKPLVLERREMVGGGAITEEFHPGFRASTLAHTLGPLRANVARDLQLDNFDCEILYPDPRDRKSTRLNSSHGYISYAVFCLKKKKR